MNLYGCFFPVAGICVAGYSSERNEILELLLPLKLYAKGNQVSRLLNKFLCALYLLSKLQNTTAQPNTLFVLNVQRASVQSGTLKCCMVDSATSRLNA